MIHIHLTDGSALSFYRNLGKFNALLSGYSPTQIL